MWKFLIVLIEGTNLDCAFITFEFTAELCAVIVSSFIEVCCIYNTLLRLTFMPCKFELAIQLLLD